MRQIPAWMLNYREIRCVGHDPCTRRDYAIRKIAERFAGCSSRVIAQVILSRPDLLREIDEAVRRPIDQWELRRTNMRDWPAYIRDWFFSGSQEIPEGPSAPISAFIIRRALPKHAPAARPLFIRLRPSKIAEVAIWPIETHADYAAALKKKRLIDLRYAECVKRILRAERQCTREQPTTRDRAH